MADQIRISDEFVDEMEQLLVEGEFSSRWTLIETYHTVGQMICTKLQGNRTELLQVLAPRVGRSVRTLFYCAKFYEVFPDLQALPEGKNTSMNQIISKHLTVSKNEDCTHPEEKTKMIMIKVCGECGKRLEKAEQKKGGE